jgi:hypothetical protein
MYDNLDGDQTIAILLRKSLNTRSSKELQKKVNPLLIDLSMLEEALPAKKNAFVLIFPTATSVVFMINERGEIMLIDSHKHSDTYGAIAATAPQNKLKDMIKYIKETMSEGKEFEETRVKLQVTSEQELSEQVEQQLSEQVSNIYARTDRSLEIIICWRQL